MIDHVPKPSRLGVQNRWRSVAVCAAVLTIGAGACSSDDTADNPACDFDTAGVKPFVMEQNIEHILGGRTYVPVNIGSTVIDGDKTLAVQMLESGPDIDLTDTDVADCGSYEIAGVPVRIRVLETSIEVWPTDGVDLENLPAVTVS